MEEARKMGNNFRANLFLNGRLHLVRHKLNVIVSSWRGAPKHAGSAYIKMRRNLMNALENCGTL